MCQCAWGLTSHELKQYIYFGRLVIHLEDLQSHEKVENRPLDCNGGHGCFVQSLSSRITEDGLSQAPFQYGERPYLLVPEGSRLRS